LWHGTADTVVSPSNLSSLEAMLARAVGAVGAATEPAEGAVQTVHRDARQRPVLETWLVTGMGHAWSGGDARGTHTYPTGPPATERMLDFLLGR
jgi:poly(3-hydroxybutyrate) depolymerase